MITDVGKSVATVKLLDGNVVNFFNKTYDLSSEIIYYNQQGNPQYVITYNETQFKNKHRCAYYTRSYSQSAIDNIPRIVLCLSGISITAPYGITAFPLYELISPSVNRLGVDEYQLSWWSNVDDISKLTLKNGIYFYNSNAIKKFSQNTLADIEENQAATKILCTAYIKWEKLAQSINGVKDITAQLTPIIVNPTIIAVIQGEGYITDFSGGGSGSGGGGGLSLHSHTSNEDGGFAGAVFMPSANMRVLNWR